jgi:carbonic anhydrase
MKTLSLVQAAVRAALLLCAAGALNAHAAPVIKPVVPLAEKVEKPEKIEKAEKAPKAAQAEHGAASAASSPSTSAASAPEKPVASGDPLEQLRGRLAEKLGAPRERTPDGSLVLRVPPRTPPEAAAGRSSRAGAAPKVALPPPPVSQVHWSYDGEAGPQAWSRLHPEFAACGSGQRQSPIDVRDSIHVQLDPVEFDYRPSSFRVIDNGHTVQVNVAAGNAIAVMGRRYELVQFHFHRPSEERLNGRLFDMVVHLVHKDLEGRLAVVAVLLERGSAQAVVQAVWNNLPLEKGEELPARITLDLNQLLPDDRSYITYMGSMTTPPCSEGVLWMVMRKPVPVSNDQIQIFSRLYPMNARPVQAAAGRMIKESN